VLGVWPLHGLCGAWGGLAAGIFGLQAFGGMGGVSFMSQLIGTGLGISIASGGRLPDLWRIESDSRHTPGSRTGIQWR